MGELDDLLDTQGADGGMQTPSTLPNATTVLVLGIISIVGCMFYAVPGLICGIIAVVLHKKDKALYLTNPLKYEASFKTSKAGHICGIVGLSLSAACLLFLVIYFVFIISVFSAAASAGGFR